MNKYTVDIVFEPNSGYTDVVFLETSCDPLSEVFSRKILKTGLREIQSGLFKNWNAVYTVGNTSYIWSFQKAETGIRYTKEVITYE